MSRRIQIAFMIVSIVAAIAWGGFGASLAGAYRYSAAGFPAYPPMESCPLSRTFYGFVENQLTSITCIGGEFR